MFVSKLTEEHTDDEALRALAELPDDRGAGAQQRLAGLGITGGKTWVLHEMCGRDAAKIVTLLDAVDAGRLSPVELHTAVGFQSTTPTIDALLGA